jgi:hypothetical protein
MIKTTALTVSLTLALFTSIAQKPEETYEINRKNAKYLPLQQFAPGITYRSKVPKQTTRLNEDEVRSLRPLFSLDLKYKTKEPDVVFDFETPGVTIIEAKNVKEGNLYFRQVSYTIKGTINFIGKDGNAFNKIVINDGTAPITVKLGSNYFRLNSFNNDRYPKPAEFATPVGVVESSHDAVFKKPEPTGFPTEEILNQFVKKHNAFIEARAEAMAIEDIFSSGAGVLESLFGTQVLSDDYPVGMVKAKNRPFNYDDFDRAGLLMTNAYNAILLNSADTVSFNPSFREALAIYKTIDAANDARLNFSSIRSILLNNMALANAFLGNTEEAINFYGLYSKNESKWALSDLGLPNIIKFMKNRVAAYGKYPEGLLSSIVKQ